MQSNILNPYDTTNAQNISELITPYTEQNQMLAKSVADILQSAETWRYYKNESGMVCAFFQMRVQEVGEFVEMGSVYSNQEIGSPGLRILIEDFKVWQKTLNALNGFSVTKDMVTAEKFASFSDGSKESFPEWFTRSKNDRYFIRWSA